MKFRRKRLDCEFDGARVLNDAMLQAEAAMPLDYPPELVCTATCNDPNCDAEITVECQYGDFKADVELKLKRKGWIIDGDAVYCSERCRVRESIRSIRSFA